MSDTHAQSQDHTRNSVSGDVRAGPGDAGAADRPEPLPKSEQYRSRSRKAGPFTAWVVAAGVVIVVVLWALF